jgi:hypothetical protein
MADTLTELYDGLCTTLESSKTDAHDELQAARAALLGSPGDPVAVGARKLYQAAVDAHAEAVAAVLATRQALAEALMPSDAEALAETLRGLIIDQRTAHRDLLDAGRELAAAEHRLQQAEDSYERICAQLNAARSELERVNRRAETLANLTNRLAIEPLLSIAATATAALAAEPYTLAQQRFEDPTTPDLPEELRDRARQRLTDENGRFDRLGTQLGEATTALLDHCTTAAGVAAQVAEKQALLDAAERALSDWVLHAEERYQLALPWLQQIVDSPPLTDAEHGRIFDAALEGDRIAALTAEGERDQALVAVEAQQAAIEDKILEDKAADIDQPPDVAALEADLVPLQSALADKQLALTEEKKTLLEQWEAAVPPHIWANLLAFQRAKAMLEDLANATPDPDVLKSAMETAEADLVASLEAQDKAQRTEIYLAARVELCRSRKAGAERTAEQRLASALRGEEPTPPLP